MNSYSIQAVRANFTPMTFPVAGTVTEVEFYGAIVTGTRAGLTPLASSSNPIIALTASAVTKTAMTSNLLSATRNPIPAIPISFQVIDFAVLSNL